MGELTGAILAGAVTGGILGGFSEGLRQLLYGEQLNVARILVAAASGALFGGVMGAVGYGLQRGFQKLHKLFASACFVAGTLVATPEGYVPIEEIQAGDIVYAADEEGNVVLSRVTHAFTRMATALVDLTIRDAEGVTTTITGTPEHPFYVPAAGDYVPMGQLVAGTALRTLDGRAATVVAVAVRRERVTVYNFEVAEMHTYFVAASQGGAGVWVHNAGG